MCVKTGKQACVYRFFNNFKELIYIGLSENAFERAKQHKAHSAWADEAVAMEITRFPTRELAAEHESLAIAIEKPKYNKHHVRDLTYPAAPEGMRIAFEHSDYPSLECDLDDMEADQITLVFSEPGVVDIKPNGFEWIKLHAGHLEQIQEALEVATDWLEEYQDSEDFVARSKLYDDWHPLTRAETVTCN